MRAGYMPTWLEKRRGGDEEINLIRAGCRPTMLDCR